VKLALAEPSPVKSPDAAKTPAALDSPGHRAGKDGPTYKESVERLLKTVRESDSYDENTSMPDIPALPSKNLPATWIADFGLMSAANVVAEPAQSKPDSTVSPNISPSDTTSVEVSTDVTATGATVEAVAKAGVVTENSIKPVVGAAKIATDPSDGDYVGRSRSVENTVKPIVPPIVAQSAAAIVSKPLLEQQPNLAPTAEIDSTDSDSGMLGLAPDRQAPAGIGPDPVRVVAAAAHGVRGIAVQIAQSLPSAQEKSVEISLDPVELGKIRLTLHATQTGMTVQVHADRPETLDLMRRNTTELAMDMRDLGFENVGFQFSQGQPDQQQNEWDAPVLLEEIDESLQPAPNVATPLPALKMMGSDRLDIRI